MEKEGWGIERKKFFWSLEQFFFQLGTRRHNLVGLLIQAI
jgi:hypothetical protein